MRVRQNMLNPVFIETLKIISQRLADNNITWSLVGSTNLSLQGLDIPPRDIDIVVTMDSLDEIKNIFAEYDVSEMEEKSSKVGGSYWRVALTINGIEVEIMRENGDGIYTHRLLAGHAIKITLGEAAVFGFDLESEILAYKETGRQNRVEMIENFLSSQIKL